MSTIYCKNSTGEISNEIEKDLSDINFSKTLKDFNFFEFSLCDLGLPSAEEILHNIKLIEKQVGLSPWRNKYKNSNHYKGFSLTYNPYFFDNTESIYHQTIGTNLITQNYSRTVEPEIPKISKDTYYDTYGFRKLPPLVNEYLGSFISKFSMSLLRSRVAYLNQPIKHKPYQHCHIDEFPFMLMRINIPLQTSEEFVINIKGDDGFNNTYELFEKHLEVGKAYIWNTRIPHEVNIKPLINKSNIDRIHLVLGFSPWYSYNSEEDSFSRSKYWGLDLKTIVEEKLFIK
jgi:hypothetical protein